MKWPKLVQFSIQLDVLGSGRAVVITMPVGLPDWENIITADAIEKNDARFSQRQACIQSELYAP